MLTSTSSHIDTSQSLWAITTYFNPIGYRSRRENYRIFRAHLPIPLIAVEYTLDGFELEPGDAEILLQFQGRDVLWQKERLWNIARNHLPAHCEEVLWIDCDVILAGDEWPGQVRDLLRTCRLVQPFHRLALLGPNATIPPRTGVEILDWRTSLVAFLANGGDSLEVYSRWGPSLSLKYAHGMAWAARRSLCERFQFYDRLIAGGGDKAFTAAVYGRQRYLAASTMFTSGYRADYLTWADSLQPLVQGGLGFTDTTAYHLWHGDVANRGYQHRQRDLKLAGFDAMSDLEIDPETQCWKWKTDKPRLREFVCNHFVDRREDG